LVVEIFQKNATNETNRLQSRQLLIYCDAITTDCCYGNEPGLELPSNKTE